MKRKSFSKKRSTLRHRFLHLSPPGGLIIGGSRVEHDTPTNASCVLNLLAADLSIAALVVSLTLQSRLHTLGAVTSAVSLTPQVHSLPDVAYSVAELNRRGGAYAKGADC